MTYSSFYRGMFLWSPLQWQFVDYVMYMLGSPDLKTDITDHAVLPLRSLWDCPGILFSFRLCHFRDLISSIIAPQRTYSCTCNQICAGLTVVVSTGFLLSYNWHDWCWYWTWLSSERSPRTCQQNQKHILSMFTMGLGGVSQKRLDLPGLTSYCYASNILRTLFEEM